MNSISVYIKRPQWRSGLMSHFCQELQIPSHYPGKLFILGVSMSCDRHCLYILYIPLHKNNREDNYGHARIQFLFLTLNKRKFIHVYTLRDNESNYGFFLMSR